MVKRQGSPYRRWGVISYRDKLTSGFRDFPFLIVWCWLNFFTGRIFRLFALLRFSEFGIRQKKVRNENEILEVFFLGVYCSLSTFWQLRFQHTCSSLQNKKAKYVKAKQVYLTFYLLIGLFLINQHKYKNVSFKELIWCDIRVLRHYHLLFTPNTLTYLFMHHW